MPTLTDTFREEQCKAEFAYYKQLGFTFERLKLERQVVGRSGFVFGHVSRPLPIEISVEVEENDTQADIWEKWLELVRRYANLVEGERSQLKTAAAILEDYHRRVNAGKSLDAITGKP